MRAFYVVAAAALLVFANTADAVPTEHSEEDKAAILAELAHAKLTVPLPVRPGAGHAAARRRSQSSDDSLNEEQLQSLADKLGAGKTLSKGQMDQMAEKIKFQGLKHKINPDHPEKNLKRVFDQMTDAEKETLRSQLREP